MFSSATRHLACCVFLLLPASGARATDVPSYHYDQQSTGQDVTEPALTSSSVVPASFGKRWTRLTDGYVYAQPLYVEGVQITQGAKTAVHNTLFVATEHDTLYALDAATGAVLWTCSLRTNGLPGAVLITAVPSKDVDTPDLVPEVGITGTPVIDQPGGYIYVAAKTKQLFHHNPYPRYVYTLFKISIGTGAIAASHIIAATYMDDYGYEYQAAADPAAAQDPFVFGDGDGFPVLGMDRFRRRSLRA